MLTSLPLCSALNPFGPQSLLDVSGCHFPPWANQAQTPSLDSPLRKCLWFCAVTHFWEEDNYVGLSGFKQKSVLFQGIELAHGRCWCKIQAPAHHPVLLDAWACIPDTWWPWSRFLVLLVCQSSLLFSLPWEKKSEQRGQGSKLQGPGGTVSESHGSSPDMRQTQSCHQDAAEIMPGRGQLSGEAHVKRSPRVAKESDFLAAASSSKPCCGAHLRDLELWSRWAALLGLLSKAFECSWGNANL